MSRHIGIVMDPIDTINPKKDSTFAMMLAAARKGWRISVMTLPNLSLRQDQFWLGIKPLPFKMIPGTTMTWSATKKAGLKHLMPS